MRTGDCSPEDRELALAKLLVEEMKELGIVDAEERPRMQISFRCCANPRGNRWCKIKLQRTLSESWEQADSAFHGV